MAEAASTQRGRVRVPWGWSLRAQRATALVVVVLAFVDGVKGPFFIRYPFELLAILAPLLLLVSPKTWNEMARRIVTPPWRGPNPVRSTLSLLLLLCSFAFLIPLYRHEHLGRFAFTAVLAGLYTVMFISDLLSPRRLPRWAVLAGVVILAAWGVLLVEAGGSPR